MITKKVSDCTTPGIVPWHGLPVREPSPSSPFRTESAGVMMGHGAFIRARAMRGMKVTVAALPLIRGK
jgi:hypothetical protein